MEQALINHNSDKPCYHGELLFTLIPAPRPSFIKIWGVAFEFPENSLIWSHLAAVIQKGIYMWHHFRSYFFVNHIAWSLEHVILTCIMSNNSNYESDETFLISIFFGHSSYLRNLFCKRFSISSTCKHFAIKNVTYVKKSMSKDLVHNDQKLSGYCSGSQVFDQFWCRCLF